MTKIFIVVLGLCISLFARVIGGVSMTVNNEPITLYEIKTFQQKHNVSAEEAVNALIQQKLENLEIKRFGIVISPYEIDKKMKELAAQNHMTIEQFKNELAKGGVSEKKLREDIEKKMQRDQLYKMVIGAKLKKPDEDELRSYYKLHKSEFNTPPKISIIEYVSTSKEALLAQRKNPMMVIPVIKTKAEVVDLAKIDPKLGQLLLQTPNGKFTPIVNLSKKVVGMFFVKSKQKGKELNYEDLKKVIFVRLMQEKQQNALIEYFEKKKSEASIDIIRKPN